MSWRLILGSGLSVVLIALVIGGGWIALLPPAPAARAATPVPRVEMDAMIAALKPPKRTRPVVAIIGINDGTETTDYLMPYGVLQRADVAEVMTLATGSGPVALYPALKVEPHATTAEFDARYPEGADYVIVPAMHRDDDPAALQWIRDQAAKGAMIIGVCAGAKVVAAAGLLDGKQATTHWYYRGELHKRHPTIELVGDRRFVIAHGVATTTGITASMPMSLTLIEAIAGHAKAEAVARELGVSNWDARHDSSAFAFVRPFALTAIGNTLAFWSRETLGIPLTAGMDEVSLALVADAWSRTSRSRALTFAASREAQTSRNGIRIIPDETASRAPDARVSAQTLDRKPADALDETLKTIAGRYDAGTADFVAMQLEYPAREQKPAGQR